MLLLHDRVIKTGKKQVNRLKFWLTSMTIAGFGLLSPAIAETTQKVNCEAAGDSILVSSTGERILEQRLVRFTPLEPYGLNTTGKRGGQRAVCMVKNDPPGFKWLRCDKFEGKYMVYRQGQGNPVPVKPVKAIPNSVLYRGWSGACLIKL